MKPTLIVITGATASGKTALSLKLAKKFNAEIISADSRQVYKGMDIGTGKVTKREQRVIKHHLIDITSPKNQFTVAQYKKLASQAINRIIKKNKVPFIVGGTPLYINALVNNLPIPEVKPNQALRRRLEKLSPEELFSILKKKDPARAGAIDPHNQRRLIRALEIITVFGKVPSPITPNVPPPRGEGAREGGEGAFLILGIKKSNSALRRAINRRVDKMFRSGLVHEVEKLIRKYGKRELFADTIGYREVIEYLEGKSTLEQAKALIKTHTWQFTRRQLTWFKKLPIQWVITARTAEQKISKFLSS